MMEKAKEHYFDGINDGKYADKDSITGNLHAFCEMSLDEQGNRYGRTMLTIKPVQASYRTITRMVPWGRRDGRIIGSNLPTTLS